MVNSISGFSQNLAKSFSVVRDDLNALRMKSAFIEEKIKELHRIDVEIRGEVTSVKRLIRNLEFKPETTPKKEVIKDIKKSFDTKEQVRGSKNPVIEEPKTKKGPELQFYDVKARKRFAASEYKEVVKNNTLFAVAKSPHGEYECYRILKKL